MKNIRELAKVIKNLKNEKEVYNLLLELFTEAELIDLSKRWRILQMLNDGITQREIAKELNVSLCKVTRGAKIVKNDKAIVTKCLRKDKINEQNYYK